MDPQKAPITVEPGRAGGAKIYDRPGAMALASRPLSLVLLGLLSLIIAYVVYYKYYAV